ncbi:MAG: AmmeMemoRadiSam system protein B [SAR324 cluster bacterium]|uniref:AmmeMemoRadiSam system protein B n=1 Tax=SAR324 cluster bacterium TaxID=2024889 RepID=A0A7X9FSA5_9DELT|nr:AmmeMemoRadiSam system protein B [SAR324 cluster bacterium]
MTDALRYPRLRWPLDIRLEQIEQQQVLIINCPLGISEKPLALMPAVGPVLACFDGTLSVEEISEKFKDFGVEKEHVKALVKLLDENLFLASPHFFAAEQKVKEDFINSRVRKAALAGLGYSSIASELDQELEQYLVKSNQENESLVDQDYTLEPQLVGLIAPHIDYKRGGKTYGLTYRHLQPKENILYILFGTAHQYSSNLFHLTLKDFEGPLGTALCDKDFVRRLAGFYGWDRSFSDELLHKREHSLELQLPFITKIQKEPCIVPILVSSFHHMLLEKKMPDKYEIYEKFISSLVKCIQLVITEGRKICVIAGVDLAHIGTHFGDPEPLSEEALRVVREQDSILIDALKERDKAKLFSHICEKRDNRKVCGFPSLYTFVDLHERLGIKYNTKLFSYEQAVDWQNDRCVSFMGMGFYSTS